MTLPESPQLHEDRAFFQQTVREEIKKRGVTNEQLAEGLGLLPIGAQVLMSESHWTLDVTYRVAEAVGLKVKVSVEPGD